MIHPHTSHCYCNRRYKQPRYESGGSDHIAVIIRVKECDSQHTKITPIWNNKKANLVSFKHLSDEKCQSITEDLGVERKVKMWNSAVLNQCCSIKNTYLEEG